MSRFLSISNLVIVVFLSLIVTGCSDKQDAIHLQSDSEIVVKINGKSLTRNQMQRELINLVLSVGADMPPEILQQKSSEFELQALQNLINTELLVDEALHRGLVISQDEIDARINVLKEAYASADQYREDLKIRALSDAELAEEARRGILVEKLIAQEFEKIASPTEGEIETFYEQNKESLTRPEQVLMSQILIQILPNDSDAVRKEKRNELVHLRQAILDGADFGEMAFQHSNCPSSQHKGDLGWINRGMVAPDILDVAFALPPGSVSDILETEIGFHLIQVRDKRPEHVPELSEIHTDIERYLLDLRRKNTVQSFIEKLRADADIDIVKVS